MSVSTLLNTKWTISTSIQIPQGGVSHTPLDVKFCSNSKIFESILITDDPTDKIIYGNTTVYDNGSWVDSNYRTISIYGGTDVTQAYLIDFLETNAVQISTNTKLVDGTILDDNLGAIATAIRAKTGDSTTIAFPAGFASSIASIPAAKTEETRTVNLDMATGNQTITPTTSGNVMTSVTVTKPATMLPENIKDGVNIGGVTGTYSGGGGSTTTKAGISEFMVECSGSYTITVSYASIGNPSCKDEDGNEYDGTNGVFQYAAGADSNTWVNINSGTLSRPAFYTKFRFLNTSTNKPFIFTGRYSDYGAEAEYTELYISGVSGAFRYGPSKFTPVPQTESVDGIWNDYNSPTGYNWQFDWVVTEVID